MTDTDRSEIEGLLAGYATTFDARDAEAFADLFTEDAVIVTPQDREIAGREKFVKMIRNTPPSDGSHRPEKPVINVNGDHASAESRYLFTSGATKEVKGSYRDEILRTKDGWRIERRVILVDTD